MHPLNPAILAAATDVARKALEHGGPPDAVYPVPVGESFLYLSTNRNTILGPDTIHIDGTTFYLGFRRKPHHRLIRRPDLS